MPVTHCGKRAHDFCKHGLKLSTQAADGVEHFIQYGICEEVTVPVVMMVAADEDPVVGLSLFLEMKKVNNLCTNY